MAEVAAFVIPMADPLASIRREFSENGSVSFTVRAHPGAKVTCLKGSLEDGSIKIDLRAAPEDGKANLALVQFLSEEFDVPKKSVEIVSGMTGRVKVIEIRQSMSP